MRQLLKAKGNTSNLLAIMFSDLAHTTGEMKKTPNDQFWRRMVIRTLAATVDGIIFTLKETTVATGSFGGYKFNNDELEFLTETMQTAGKRPKFLRFQDNLKETFKWFYKVHSTPCGIDFGQDGFAALCETYELRNRITHPKNVMTFCVSDSEKVRAGEAIAWLNAELHKLFGSCGSRYEQVQS